jgi:Predicted RNA-binding protein containing KH domain, possibly ribosomal protein
MLSSKDRSRLASIAQNRDCLISLGRGGARDAFAERLGQLLEQHELVKLRFGDFKEEKADIAAALAKATGSEVVRRIGNVAIFWKRNPDPQKRKVELE